MRLQLEPNASNSVPVNVISSDADDQARFTEYLNSGVKAAQSGDRQRARKLLMSAVEIDPHSENAWLWLASISEYPEVVPPTVVVRATNLPIQASMVLYGFRAADGGTRS